MKHLLPSIFVSFFLSLEICLLLLPKVIKWVNEKDLVDNPNERSAHLTPTPTMGGIAVFCALLLPTVSLLFLDIKYALVLIALVIIFVTGVVDDLKELSPMKKMSGQFVAATLLAIAGFRIPSFYGIFGIEEIHVVLQYGITIIAVIGITNAFNLIDGVDGLTGGIVMINSFIFGLVFLLLKDLFFAVFCFAMVGAYLGFLKFNFHPAKIFMGDSGSLVAGFLMSMLALRLLPLTLDIGILHIEGSSMALFVVGLLFLPIFDFIRVVIHRIMAGSHPMKADKNHAHHLLLNEGLNHKSTSLTLYSIHTFLVLASLVLHVFPFYWALALLFVMGYLLVEIFDVRKYRRVKTELRGYHDIVQDKMEVNQLLWKEMSNYDVK